ncbi:metal ABC transporter substrate-binding protein [Halosimplex salinum]|uniref:metal ABC transporter substrate-binding protein n=1 Tax=Halosimplex salinum TaxID=1710538 RepID=UPI000F484B72|nr:metal ABC transporter substrate-binding protein [Halosimplex salinum]
MDRYTRRAFLGAAAGVPTVTALAGCSGSAGPAGGGATDGGDERSVAQSSFFVFGDFARHVAGDAARAETLVPIGQHGHGWEPGPQVRQSVAEADLFVYGMEGFQPWADDIVRDVRADEEAVRPVAVGADVDLIDADHGEGDASHDEHTDEGHDDEHTDEGHGDEHTDDGHGDEHTDDGHGDEHTDDGHGDEHTDDGHGDEHTETGHHEEEHTDEGHGDRHEDEHDHGVADPHFWLDPRRASAAVERVREAFEAVDPDNASRYAENATAYRERLDALDESFESRLAGATKDVVLVAGHDAFGYLGARYGVEFVTLTGLSPDQGPTARDIERAQHRIEEHDLRYVCADPLESQRAATELVAETDAEAVLPLTSIPGRSEGWAEEGWGYVDVMESVNLPTLERALEVE